MGIEPKPRNQDCSTLDAFTLLATPTTVYYNRNLNKNSRWKFPSMFTPTQNKSFTILAVLRRSVKRVCGTRLRIIASMTLQEKLEARALKN